MSADDHAEIIAAVRALPPLAEDRVEHICDLIVAARARWRRDDARRHPA